MSRACLLGLIICMIGSFGCEKTIREVKLPRSPQLAVCPQHLSHQPCMPAMTGSL